MRAGEAAAWAGLDAALLATADRGEQVPCGGRWDEFTADDVNVRRVAARACAGCPVLVACRALLPFVWHGVWAGVVVTQGKRERGAA